MIRKNINPFIFFAILTLATTAAFGNWVGDPIELSSATAKAVDGALTSLGYPELENGWRLTGITPDLGCSGKSACRLIVLSKDILPKNCFSYPPVENYAEKDVAFSKAESDTVIQRFQTAGFPEVSGKIAVGSYCGGLVLECTPLSASCTAHIYSF